MNLNSDDSLEQFFDLVKNNQLEGLEIHNRVQELTDNYDEEKLNLLCKDFDNYLGIIYQEWLGTFTNDEVEKKIQELKEQDQRLPLNSDEAFDPIFVNDHFTKKTNGQTRYVEDTPFIKILKNEINSIKDNPIDTNRLMGGFFFSRYPSHSIRTLRNILVKLKSKHTSSVYKFNDKPKDLQTNNNHINWLKSDESREQFIEALKEHDLIEERETKAIINDHFEPVREQNKEPEPIKWRESIALLAYMIEQLDRRSNKYIDPDDIWKDTVSHFIKNGQTPENMKQTANRYKKYNKSGKPKNYHIIDNIIQSLSD